MKAPDKIYLGIQDLGSGYAYAPSLYDNGEQEYIRKEALLEWLEYEKEWFEGTDIEPHYQKVIDKLNEM